MAFYIKRASKDWRLQDLVANYLKMEKKNFNLLLNSLTSFFKLKTFRFNLNQKSGELQLTIVECISLPPVIIKCYKIL